MDSVTAPITLVANRISAPVTVAPNLIYAPFVSGGLPGSVVLPANAYAPSGTVSFPGFGATHNSAAYGDHDHAGVYQPLGSYASALHDHAGVYAPFGTVSFPGFGATHSSAAYGDHNHSGVYAPYSTVSFPGFGATHATASYGDHNHSGVYAPFATVSFPGFGTTHSTAAYGDHTHAGVYALVAHNHTGVYAPYATVSFPGFGANHSTSAYGDHNHTGVYAAAAHTHDYSGVYAPFGTVSFPGFGATHSSAAYGDHDHAGVYAAASHTHDYSSVYAPYGTVSFPGFGATHSSAAYGDHDHAGVYAPASHTHTGFASSASFIAGAGALTGPAAPLTIGTAAGHAAGDFATAAQGTIAGTAIQPDLPAMLVIGTGTSANIYVAKAVGQSGKLITVAHAEPYGTAGVSVGVSGNAITVTPGSKARMICGVILTNGGGGEWKSPNPNGSYCTYVSGSSEEWSLHHHTLTSGPYNVFSNSDADTPDQIPAGSWFPDDNYDEPDPAFSVNTFSALASTAAQVAAAVNAYSPASALVTASGSGDGTAVTQGATHLGVSFGHAETHRIGGTNPLTPADIGAASKRQYKKASFTAEAYGWYHVVGSATADGGVVVTDPPNPVEGDIYDITIASGWVRVGNVDRQQSLFVIEREFDGSVWVTLEANLSVVLNANGGSTSAGLTLTEVLGSEKVADPGFGTSGSWTKGADWTVASGKATHGTGTVGSLVPNPDLTAAIGTVYKIQLVFTALSVGGLMTLVFGGVTTTYTLPTGAQTYTVLVKATATTGFSLAMATAVRCDIDSMTIKPVTVGGERVTGLVEYATGTSHIYADAAAKNAHRAAMGVGTGDSVVFAAVTANGGLTTGGTVTFGSTTTFSYGTGIAAKHVTALTGVVDDANTTIALATTDSGYIKRCTAATAVGITTPSTDPGAGWSMMFIQYGAGQVTHTAYSGHTIYNADGYTKTRKQYSVSTLIRVANGVYILSGDLA